MVKHVESGRASDFGDFSIFLSRKLNILETFRAFCIKRPLLVYSIARIVFDHRHLARKLNVKLRGYF